MEIVDGAVCAMPDTRELTSDVGVWDRTDGQPEAGSNASRPVSLFGPGPVECASLRWFVARHRPWEDQTAAQRLRAAGFQAHAFREIVRQHRQHDVMRPLFPGYLFVRADAWHGLGRVLSLFARSGQPVVTGVMATPAGVPLAVPDAVIDGFLKDTNDLDIWTPRPAAGPDRSGLVGGQFEIGCGAWTSFIGRCVGVSGKKRIDLLVEVFGRDVVVRLKDSQVRRVS